MSSLRVLKQTTENKEEQKQPELPRSKGVPQWLNLLGTKKFEQLQAEQARKTNLRSYGRCTHLSQLEHDHFNDIVDSAVTGVSYDSDSKDSTASRNRFRS